MWQTYAVRLHVCDRLAGSLPKEPGNIGEMIRRRWEQANKRPSDMVRSEFIDECRRYLRELGEAERELTDEEILEAATRKAEASLNVFRRDKHGLYIPAHSIKSALKESINIVYAGERFGPTSKGGVSFLAERVFIEPDRLYLGRHEADGIDTVHGNVSGMQGPRSIVTTHEYVIQPQISFIMKVMTTADQDTARKTAAKAAAKATNGKVEAPAAEGQETEIRNKMVRGLAARWPRIWKSAEHQGIGSLRARSEYGRFVVERFDRLTSEREIHAVRREIHDVAANLGY
jgi:hypothetical protein